MKPSFFERSPLYIFLISIYPVLYLLSVNIREVSPIVAIRSGMLFLLGGSILFFLMFLLTRDVQRSAFFALIDLVLFFIIFFMLYAPVYRALRYVNFAGNVLGRHRILVPFTFLLLAITTICLVRFWKILPQKFLNNISIFFNIVALTLTVIPVVTMLSETIISNQEMARTRSTLPPIEPLIIDSSKSLPDIYYIILDMHTNDNVLKNLLDYNDSSFTQDLEDRGFFVSQCSQSNYPNTRLSLTSTLNMDYLQNFNFLSGNNGMYPAMQESLVQRMLEKIGYSTYSFETGYWFTEIKNSTHYSAPTNGAINLITYPGVTSFESLVLSISAGQVLYENRTELTKKMQVIIDAPYTQRRADILNVLDSLPEIPFDTGPKFVFAHMLAPHDPFVFDEYGNPAFRRTPFTDVDDPEFGEGYGWESYKGPYVKELIYLHDRMLYVVDKILSESQTPPIIIIQGDHGIPFTKQFNAEFQILNAYYFPGIENSVLYDQISPVNSFRILFNEYFGSNYPKLEDLSYLVEESFILFDNALYPCP